LPWAAGEQLFLPLLGPLGCRKGDARKCWIEDKKNTEEREKRSIKVTA